MLPLKVNSPSSDLRVAAQSAVLISPRDHVVGKGDQVAGIAHAVADPVGVLAALGDRRVGGEIAELDPVGVVEEADADVAALLAALGVVDRLLVDPLIMLRRSRR